MSQPTLFLDVDGVLNTRLGSLDEDKLELVRYIVAATGCKVVLSSSWRLVKGQFRRIEGSLRVRGVELHGITPECVENVAGLAIAKPRWEEIALWRLRNGQPSPFVILDDGDMGPINEFLVRTDAAVGLTQKQANEVIERLKK